MRTPITAASPPARYALPLLVAALLVAALLVSSCSDSDDKADSKPSNRPAEQSSPAEQSRTSAPPSPRTTPSPTPPRAADGSNVKACRNADCEILLRGSAEIPVRPSFGFTKFTLSYEKPKTVTFDVQRPEYGAVSGYIGGKGFLSLANGVTVTIKEIDSRGAVLRFEPKAMDRNNDQASGSEGLSIVGG